MRPNFHGSCYTALTGLTLCEGEAGGELDLCVGDVEGGYGLHAQLGRIFRGEILGVICAIEVFSRYTAFASRHVPPYDEMCAACITFC